MFKSSLKVGSTFLEIESKDVQDDSDIIIMGRNDTLEDSYYSSSDSLDHNGYFKLKNTTDSTIVAYYVYTNQNNLKTRKYRFKPQMGFLVPDEITKICVQCRDYS